MNKRLNLHNIGIKGITAVALVASLLLSACQSEQDAPSADDTEQTSKDQDVKLQGNTEGSQGGAVVNAHQDGVEEPATDTPNASKKTSFDDLWMLDKVTVDGTTLYNDKDVVYYGTTYETVLAIELTDDENGKFFAAALPGADLIGTWEETSETHADLQIEVTDAEPITMSYDMSADYQTAELSTDDGNLVYSFHRDDDTTITLDSMYETMVENNDKFYDELPIDVAQDVTFVDDDNVQMRLLGTTHTENEIGYVIEVTNKTTTPLILNDFVWDGQDYFTVNGTIQAKPLLGRVLPPVITDSETNEQKVAPMRCAILFSKEELGDIAINNVIGNIVVTDYSWNEVGRYPFTI